MIILFLSYPSMSFLAFCWGTHQKGALNLCHFHLSWLFLLQRGAAPLFAIQSNQFSSFPLGNMSLAYPDLGQLGHTQIDEHTSMFSSLQPGTVSPDRSLVKSIDAMCSFYLCF